ncbi:phosphocarrier protein HPr [Clostridium homopropionicum DSM 5847]|uniref:Phosphocarrier protein HPr n=1 Tax=Clostridium homopropionicum DSM 5847 TaxID=1121318 RepID=A0A0L6Z570_9CLOT|nr:HPr family phosphocarrier protein [Clostridium homopropionicum]KOA18105.1 phosphocarrier protein HPr [Clostridium homopropionicum DSM 5847]SFG72054.1 phosphocarrier protein [Clostridium homopropionicum]
MEKTVVIKNEKGIHIRPAGEFVKTASKYKSQVQIDFKGKKVNGKSVMILMSLGLKKGNEITIITNGEDAEEALNALVELVESGFGE